MFHIDTDEESPEAQAPGTKTRHDCETVRLSEPGMNQYELHTVHAFMLQTPACIRVPDEGGVDNNGHLGKATQETSRNRGHPSTVGQM